MNKYLKNHLYVVSMVSATLTVSMVKVNLLDIDNDLFVVYWYSEWRRTRCTHIGVERERKLIQK